MKPQPLFQKKRIFAPGPTPVPEEVAAELGRSPLHHRTKEFGEILGRVREGLKYLFQTKEPVYLFASSGTGAMECTLVNLFSPGDEVLVVNGGKFGERWGKISESYGLKVHWLPVEWGTGVQPDAVAEQLKKSPRIQAVLFQGSETSTGAYHPVQAIAKTIQENSDALVVVDAVTTLGVMDLPMDEWGLDAVVSGSQKALMLPPGLAFLSLSQKARSRVPKSTLPKFYFNLKAEDKAWESGQTAFTPAVGLVCALEKVLTRFQAVGLNSVFDYHQQLAEATRRGAQALELKLFAEPPCSNAVTAIHVPTGIEGKKVVSVLRDRFGLTIAGGQDQWKGKIFRIGHLGHYDELDVLTVLAATELTLQHLGYACTLGKGVSAASEYFSKSS